jgi:hypothetical protein
LETPGVNHEALSETCHVQLALVVIVTLLELASAPRVSVVGATANVQLIPCWVTVTVVPATVSCALRDAVPVFAVTEKERVAGPVPLVTAGVNHVALSATCHVQPSSVSTVTVPEPAAAVSVSVAGVTVNVQVGGLNWVTFTVVPATVNCAVRAEAPVFAVAENETVALPEPLDTAGVSQAALSETCQVQPELVVI